MFSRIVENFFKGCGKIVSLFLLLGAMQVTPVFAGERHDGGRHIDHVQTFSGAVIYAAPYYPVPYVRHWQPVFGGHHYNYNGGHHGYGEHHHGGCPAWRGRDGHSHHGHKGHPNHGHHSTKDQFYRPDKNNHRNQRGDKDHGSRH